MGEDGQAKPTRRMQLAEDYLLLVAKESRQARTRFQCQPNASIEAGIPRPHHLKKNNRPNIWRDLAEGRHRGLLIRCKGLARNRINSHPDQFATGTRMPVLVIIITCDKSCDPLVS